MAIELPSRNSRNAAPYGSDYAYKGFNKGDGTSYRLELVKIGSIENGTTISEGDWKNFRIATYQYGGVDTVRILLFGNLKVAERTCVTQPVKVTMNSQDASKFGGVNTHLTPVPFAIKLNRCSAGLKSIKYRLDPQTKIFNKEASVITLNDSSSASGIGVQILDGAGNPLPLGVEFKYSDYRGSGDYSIPLKAAYYKIDSSVKGGTANTSLTFTMSYQ